MKKLEKNCGNCRLFNKKDSHCSVTVLLDGQRYNMPVDESDNCHMEDLGIEVQQVRWWVEDPDTGEPSKKGVVKMEYPEGFFGDLK